MANGRLSKFSGRNNSPHLSCPHCGETVLTLHQRAGLCRPHSRKCKFCLNHYRIPVWCNVLQIGGLILYLFISAYFKFFSTLGYKPALIINALIAVAISYLIGIALAFVAPLQKDEYTGTASKRQERQGDS